jgi:isoleucyl-tRNA synthetase
MVQDARKAAGLQVSDRILLAVNAVDQVGDALRVHRDWIAGETLAVRVAEAVMDDADRVERGEINGIAVEIGLQKV